MEIILIGDSGHAKVIRDCVASSGHKVIAMLDDKYDEVHISSSMTRGPIEHVYTLLKEANRKVLISIGNNEIRKNITYRLNLLDNNYATIIHKSAIISNSAKIGIGSVILPGAILNADSQIGNHCIINTNAVVEHDCIVSDFVHISPNSTLTGGVKVCKGVHLGAGSTVIPLKSIGKWTTVGAGSVVIDDLPPNCTAVGIPAKPIKFHNQ